MCTPAMRRALLEAMGEPEPQEPVVVLWRTDPAPWCADPDERPDADEHPDEQPAPVNA